MAIDGHHAPAALLGDLVKNPVRPLDSIAKHGGRHDCLNLARANMNETISYLKLRRRFDEYSNHGNSPNKPPRPVGVNSCSKPKQATPYFPQSVNNCDLYINSGKVA